MSRLGYTQEEFESDRRRHKRLRERFEEMNSVWVSMIRDNHTNYRAEQVIDREYSIWLEKMLVNAEKGDVKNDKS